MLAKLNRKCKLCSSEITLDEVKDIKRIEVEETTGAFIHRIKCPVCEEPIHIFSRKKVYGK